MDHTNNRLRKSTLAQILIDRIDDLLAEQPHARQPIVVRDGKTPIRAFRDGLLFLLKDGSYDQWISAELPNITKEVRDRIVDAIEKPEPVANEIARLKSTVFARADDGSVLVNRPFISQIAAGYDDHTAYDIRRLTEIVYYHQMCKTQGAEARSSLYLREPKLNEAQIEFHPMRVTVDRKKL